MKGDVLTVTVPLPSVKLSSNGSHGHWAARRDALEEQRLGACAIMRQAFQEARFYGPYPFAQKVRISSDWWTGKPAKKPVVSDGRYRPQDAPNAVSAMKGIFDGFVDAGLMPDDKAAYLILGDTEIHVPKESGTRCEIELKIEVLA